MQKGEFSIFFHHLEFKFINVVQGWEFPKFK